MLEVVEAEDLKGKIITMVIKPKDNELFFFISAEEVYKMYHNQECCEDVHIEDICGELDWLLGSPLLIAEERTDKGMFKDRGNDILSYTWTFYEFATIKGSVTIRWYGTSSGYYSEEAYLLRGTLEDFRDSLG